MYSPRDPIAEYWRGEITLRKLRVLIEGLPPGCAYYRAIHGHGWTDAEYLAAMTVDAVRENTFVSARVAGGKLSKPKPVRRPGDEDRGKTRIGHRGEWSPAQAKAYLDSFAPESDRVPVPALPGVPQGMRPGEAADAVDAVMSEKESDVHADA